METMSKLVSWIGRALGPVGRRGDEQHLASAPRWMVTHCIPEGICECGERGVVGMDGVWLCATCARLCVVCLAGGVEREVVEAQWGEVDGVCAEHQGTVVDSLPLGLPGA